jgi:AcrR family transcriptional regulator
MTAATKVKRAYDSNQSMSDILTVATAEFAEKGFSGARVDEIAELTRTSKRMIYYHFESKEGLYRAVLEAAYGRVREHETTLALDDLPPDEALAKLVGFSFDTHRHNEAFVRLVMNENIMRASTLQESRLISQLNVPIIETLKKLLQRGADLGLFKTGLDPVLVHRAISGLCFHNVSNQHTFSLIFNHDPSQPKVMNAYRQCVIDMVLSYVKA